MQRANYELRRGRRIGLEWDRAHCLAYVWRQARALRAEFLGCPVVPVQKRKAPRLRTPSVPKTAKGRRFGRIVEPKNRSVTERTPDPSAGALPGCSILRRHKARI